MSEAREEPILEQLRSALLTLLLATLGAFFGCTLADLVAAADKPEAPSCPSAHEVKDAVQEVFWPCGRPELPEGYCDGRDAP